VFLWCQSGFILSRFDCWGIGGCGRVQFWSSRWGRILWPNIAHHPLQFLTLWSRKKKKATSSDIIRCLQNLRCSKEISSHAKTFYCKLRLSFFAYIDSMWSLKQLWLHLVLSWQMRLIQSNFWIAWRNWRVVYRYRYLCMISSAIKDLWTQSARYLFFFFFSHPHFRSWTGGMGFESRICLMMMLWLAQPVWQAHFYMDLYRWMRQML